MLSDKQRSYLAHSDAFLNAADGAVRSGKTHSALHKLSYLALKGPPGDFGVFGKTERTVKRNIVLPLVEMHPRGAVRYIQGSGELYLFGRRCWVVGLNDVRAEEKIRGMTLAGGLVNEATLAPEESFDQIIDRCSVTGAQLLADMNPDSPYHWMMVKFLGAGLPKGDLKRWRFNLYDNPVLSQGYIDRLNRIHAPDSMWHRRMVLGEWVLAEGAIYEQWDEAEHVVDEMPAKPERVVIGIDYGTQNATVFLAAGKVGKTWYVFDEYYHSGRQSSRQKTDAEYSREFLKFLGRIGYMPSSVEVDPSAQHFIAQLRQDGVRRIRNADHAVVDGIQVVSRGLTAGTLKVLRKCEHLRAEFPNYVWDEKKQEQGVDMPLKNDNDHALDALRYLAARVLGRADLKVLPKPAGF